MIHPSYKDLMAVVNSEVEEGEQPVVQSRYSIVIATSKRARDIISGEEPLIDNAAGMKPLSIAVSELYTGKVKIVSDEDISEDWWIFFWSSDEKLIYILLFAHYIYSHRILPVFGLTPKNVSTTCRQYPMAVTLYADNEYI